MYTYFQGESYVTASLALRMLLVVKVPVGSGDICITGLPPGLWACNEICLVLVHPNRPWISKHRVTAVVPIPRPVIMSLMVTVSFASYVGQGFPLPGHTLL